MKVTESVCAASAPSTLPAAGLYTKVPGTLAGAFNCVALRAVPYVIGAGFAQVIVGITGWTR